MHSAATSCAAWRAQLSPFAVERAVDKHWTGRCRPRLARLAGIWTFFVQCRAGYARSACMWLWTSSGTFPAAQQRRGLQGIVHLLIRQWAAGCGQRRCPPGGLSTAGVDEGVDKLRAAGCRPRRARLAGNWTNPGQSPPGPRWPGCPLSRGISLWISSGWIARPRQPRAARQSGGFLYSARRSACTQSACTRLWTTSGQSPAGHGWRGLQGIVQKMISPGAGGTGCRG